MKRILALALILILCLPLIGCCDYEICEEILCFSGFMTTGDPNICAAIGLFGSPNLALEKGAASSNMFYAAAPAQSELYFPQIASGGGYVTTITLMHTDAWQPPTPAKGKLSFFTQIGTPRTVETSEMGNGTDFDITIPVAGVRVLTIASAGDLSVGSARFVAEGVAVAGVATYTFGAAVVGVLGATPIHLGYVPLNTRPGFQNGLAIQNPGTAPLNIRFRLINPDGTVNQTSSPPETNPLPGLGQIARFVGPELGFSGEPPANSTLEIEVQGEGNFVALSLVFGNDTYSSAAVVSSDIEAPLVFPQIADGGGYVTALRLFNPGINAVNGTLRFYNPNGAPRQIALINRGTASTFQLSIPAQGTLVLETEGKAPEVGVGFARVDGFAPIGGTATIFFGKGHLGIPASARMRSARIALNTTQGYNTGVALAAGFDPVNLSLSLENRDGELQQTVRPAEVNPLPEHGQIARYVTQMGFENPSGLSDSSLLVEPVGGGSFIPLALLDREGVFSTTATARQTLFSPSDYSGNYFGHWDNNMYSGTLSLSFFVDESTNIARGTFTIVDELPPINFSGTFGPDGFTTTSTPQALMVVKPDGTLSFRINLTNGQQIASLTLVGEFNGSGFSGTFDLAAGPSYGMLPLSGTWSLEKN